jgi:hypothetical protein
LTSALGGQFEAPAALPIEIFFAILIVYEAIWVPEPVWKNYIKEKFLVTAGNRTSEVYPLAYRYTD